MFTESRADIQKEIPLMTRSEKTGSLLIAQIYGYLLGLKSTNTEWENPNWLDKQRILTLGRYSSKGHLKVRRHFSQCNPLARLHKMFTNSGSVKMLSYTSKVEKQVGLNDGIKGLSQIWYRNNYCTNDNLWRHSECRRLIYNPFVRF
jgi:hypothetical protein